MVAQRLRNQEVAGELELWMAENGLPGGAAVLKKLFPTLFRLFINAGPEAWDSMAERLRPLAAKLAQANGAGNGAEAEPIQPWRR